MSWSQERQVQLLQPWSHHQDPISADLFWCLGPRRTIEHTKRDTMQFWEVTPRSENKDASLKLLLLFFFFFFKVFFWRSVVLPMFTWFCWQFTTTLLWHAHWDLKYPPSCFGGIYWPILVAAACSKYVSTAYGVEEECSGLLFQSSVFLSGDTMYSPTTWGPKQRISDYKHQQHSFNMSVEMDDHERKIVNEFCHYLEKSKQLFNGLR